MEQTSQAAQEQDVLLARGERVPLSVVHDWMNSADLEVQARVYGLLNEHPERLAMPPERERDQFFLRYLERCLHDNPGGEFALNRYLAGHSLSAWFQHLWRERPGATPLLEQIRDMLARLIQSGDAALRDAIVTAVLEHLFQEPEVAQFFRGWTNDPVLSALYAESLLLSQP